MITLKLVQGSVEWLAARMELFGASEAPSMMNDSKFMSRNELLKLKFTGKAKPVSAHLQKIYDKGHATEEMARPIVEAKIDEELYPVTGQLENSKIMASFDGLTIMEDTAFEHKLYNATLAENVRNNVLEMHYVWQLEQQLLVSGAEKVIFVTSDGTEDNYESMEYFSTPERREALISGWSQFEKDLSEYQPEVKKETVVAKEIATLPSLEIELVGEVSNSNLAVYKGNALAFIESIRTDLQTDQDFKDADAAIKFCDSAEKELEEVKKRALSKTESIDVLFKTIDELKEKMREKRLTLSKLATTRKKEINNKFIWGSVEVIGKYIEAINKEINPMRLESVIDCPLQTHFELAIKGKRTIESKKNAVDGVIAEFKVMAEAAKTLILLNLSTLRELAGEYEFLFNDSSELVCKQNEDLIAVIKIRISDHKEAKAKELSEQTAKIEAAAKLKAENEAAAKLEAQRESMRLEEESKAQHKIKVQNLVKSWQDAFNSIKISDSVEFVQAKFDWISSSNCDEKILGDSFDEALDIYDNCYRGISKRLEFVKAIPTEVKPDHLEHHETCADIITQEIDKAIEKPVSQRLSERFANVDIAQDEPEVNKESVHDKMNTLMYALTKSAARTSFDEFLEDWGLTNADYEEIKSFMAENLGGMKTYL